MINIADLIIDWQSDFSEFAEAFAVAYEQAPIMKMSFCGSLPECHGVSYIGRPVEHFLKTDRGDVLIANSDWSEATSYGLLKNDRDFTLPLAAVCSRLSYFGTVLAHASLVSYRGEGVMFTGYSGVGKTTQAELWEKQLGAEIINGDKVLLRQMDGKFYACGLPWKGSSDYCRNINVPLKAIVVLKQARENRIFVPDEKTELTMPHIFLPHWDNECLNNALDTFDALVKSVPIYSLECCPDEGAVNLACEVIYG